MSGSFGVLENCRLEEKFNAFLATIPLSTIEIEKLLGLQENTLLWYPWSSSCRGEDFSKVQEFMSTYPRLQKINASCNCLCNAQPSNSQ